MTGRLSDMRVVELGGGVAVAYAGKLFADAGAEVWVVEPPGGDPLRRWSASGADLGGGDGALFRFLAGGKRSLVGQLGDDAVDGLVAGADLVVESLAPGTVEAAGLLDQPGLVVLSISPFGRGSWAGRPATEMTVQAVSGSISARVYAEGPLQAGGGAAEWAAGVFGAPAALAAVRHARGGGAGTHVDVSMAEVMCICTNLFIDLMMDLLGRPPLGLLGAASEFPAIEATADGWVGFNTNSAQMFQDFLVMVDRADLSGDPTLRSDPVRRADLERSVHEWCLARTTDEIVELAAGLRVPSAPVGNGANLPRHPHLAARGTFGRAPDGSFVYPRPPYRLNGRRPPDLRPAPAVGGDDPGPGRIRVAGDSAPASAAPELDEADLPMAGLKVLDMTCWWAGPGVSQLYAALGADVIHVEAVQRMDGMRPAATLVFADRDQWWEYSSFFLTINTNKRGITLNLDDPDGLDLARRLARWADVVIENYTPRVMERFGLDAPGIHALNPAAVVVRMPAFGLDGPWRDRVGFAQTMEAMCGMAWITGAADGPPRLPRGPCDPIGAMHAAFATQVALIERESTGAGQVVEAALLESGLCAAAEQVIEHSAYGVLLARAGNRSPGAAPQGVYECRGDQRWLAVSVTTDPQWEGLRRACGDPPWSRDPALANLAGRAAAADLLDAGLADWAAARQVDEAAETLLAEGVPAAVVADFRHVAFHPLFLERGFFEEVDHPVVGRHPMFGMPFRWRGISRWLRRPAPTLGQHNDEVLGQILGLSHAELGALAERKVIGTRPEGA
jgi:crotonobetainyl-CoA:carnitine CoA-transferase CaiB-like acyl-CoA transferase